MYKELFLYNFCIWTYSVLTNYVQDSYCKRLKSLIQSTTQLYTPTTLRLPTYCHLSLQPRVPKSNIIRHMSFFRSHPESSFSYLTLKENYMV